MGFLSDNLPAGQTVVDCIDLYPYGIVVAWEKADRYMALDPADFLAVAVQGVLPDVEDWQLSARSPARGGQTGHVTFRFHDQAQRDQAQTAISHAGVELVLRSVTLVNAAN